MRNSDKPEIKSIQHISKFFSPLVNHNKFLKPSQHIKVGLLKNIVKAMAKHSLNGFESFSNNFLNQPKPN